MTDEGRQATFADLTIDNADGPRRLVVNFVVCPNPACRRFSLSASLHGQEIVGSRSYTGKHLKTWALVPPSRAQSFPIALPPHILELPGSLSSCRVQSEGRDDPVAALPLGDAVGLLTSATRQSQRRVSPDQRHDGPPHLGGYRIHQEERNDRRSDGERRRRNSRHRSLRGETADRFDRDTHRGLVRYPGRSEKTITGDQADHW